MHTTYTAITNNIKGNKFCLFKYVKKDRFAFSWRSFYYIDKFLNLISRNLDSVPFINLRHLRFYTFNTQYCISSVHIMSGVVQLLVLTRLVSQLNSGKSH